MRSMRLCLRDFKFANLCWPSMKVDTESEILVKTQISINGFYSMQATNNGRS